MKKIIEITVDSKGNSQVETKGYSGNGCREASRFLEEALGIRQAERLTAEFHQGQETRQTNQQQT